jgi:Trk K+ transport system NAD-binding subunit
VALRRSGVHLDNIALIPASQLPFKEHWQQLANELPRGSVLVCIPEGSARERMVVEKVVSDLRARGRTVAVLDRTVQ